MTALLGFSGSLRRRSFNTALLRATAELAPEGVTLTLADYRDVPLYDGDLETPASVERLKAEVAAADGVIIATPEYNYGIPGPLKNVLDWLSRPAYQSVFRDKPVAILGAAPGVVGTARAQGQLKQVLLGMASEVFPWPEVLVGSCAARFDDSLALTDEKTREVVGAMVAAFAMRVARGR
ncbi:MAG: NAD(P)H-dependent oxidoreductase [Myxococcales bacterium]|nr:NAD(P)H-dependent oxidoreductase [Myxococcales bacterium]